MEEINGDGNDISDDDNVDNLTIPNFVGSYEVMNHIMEDIMHDADFEILIQNLDITEILSAEGNINDKGNDASILCMEEEHQHQESQQQRPQDALEFMEPMMVDLEDEDLQQELLIENISSDLSSLEEITQQQSIDEKVLEDLVEGIAQEKPVGEQSPPALVGNILVDLEKNVYQEQLPTSVGLPYLVLVGDIREEVQQPVSAQQAIGDPIIIEFVKDADAGTQLQEQPNATTEQRENKVEPKKSNQSEKQEQAPAPAGQGNDTGGQVTALKKKVIMVGNRPLLVDRTVSIPVQTQIADSNPLIPSTSTSSVPSASPIHSPPPSTSTSPPTCSPGSDQSPPPTNDQPAVDNNSANTNAKINGNGYDVTNSNGNGSGNTFNLTFTNQQNDQVTLTFSLPVIQQPLPQVVAVPILFAKVPSHISIPFVKNAVTRDGIPIDGFYALCKIVERQRGNETRVCGAILPLPSTGTNPSPDVNNNNVNNQNHNQNQNVNNANNIVGNNDIVGDNGNNPPPQPPPPTPIAASPRAPPRALSRTPSGTPPRAPPSTQRRRRRKSTTSFFFHEVDNDGKTKRKKKK